jgi:serine/threonine protein kinase
MAFYMHAVLGQGGFGIVLLVFDLEKQEVCALKTFRDELLTSPQARAAFKQEASRWVDIGEHPFILTARSVREISNRLFVKMDHVARDEDGRVSLAHYLRGRTSQPIPPAQQLEWGIQFCLGMEHANEHGIRCHRDIKPENILITSDKAVKISDFGLALVAESASAETDPPVESRAGPGGQQFSLSIINAGGKRICGTPGYIPPEIYRGEPGDVRSDIYSFGLVLWQMAAQSPGPPFSHYLQGSFEAYLRTIYETQMAGQAPSVDSPLQPVVSKCLTKTPVDRYQSFAELREDLETLLWREAGRSVEVPDKTQATATSLHERANSLSSVGRHEEALVLMDQALQIAPDNIALRVSRAASLHKLGRITEAVQCCDEALSMKPDHPAALLGKGALLDILGQPQEAMFWLDRILEKSPNHLQACQGKIRCLLSLNRADEALVYCDRILQFHPKSPVAWDNKAVVLRQLGRLSEAIACSDRAIACDPQLANAWLNKGTALTRLRQFSEAIRCLDKALGIDATFAAAWSEKGRNLRILKRNSEAIPCFEKALAIEPNYAIAWYNKGLSEEILRRFPDAIASFSKYLQLAGQREPNLVANASARLQRMKRLVSARSG